MASLHLPIGVKFRIFHMALKVQNENLPPLPVSSAQPLSLPLSPHCPSTNIPKIQHAVSPLHTLVRTDPSASLLHNSKSDSKFCSGLTLSNKPFLHSRPPRSFTHSVMALITLDYSCHFTCLSSLLRYTLLMGKFPGTSKFLTVQNSAIYGASNQ